MAAGSSPKRRGRFPQSGKRHEAAILFALAALFALLAIVKVADASLSDRVDSAKQQADALRSQIGRTSDEIAALEADAAAARARIAELTQTLRAGEERSNRLAAQQTAVKDRLDAARARLQRARGVLSERLVAIYKEGEPDAVQFVLDSDSVEDLATRADYLGAIEDADSRAADRVHELAAEVDSELQQVVALKEQIDAHNRALVSARDQMAAARVEIKRQAAQLAGARVSQQRALEAMRAKIRELEAQIGRKGVNELFGDGQYAIPTYIVMCESGGNYRAVNPSSGAGGAYQIMPATWHGYGGKGLPQDASPAEQDRIAALIWKNSGSGPWTCA